MSLAAEEEDSFHSLVVEEEIEVPQAVSVGIRIQVRVVTVERAVMKPNLFVDRVPQMLLYITKAITKRGVENVVYVLSHSAQLGNPAKLLGLGITEIVVRTETSVESRDEAVEGSSRTGVLFLTGNSRTRVSVSQVRGRQGL